MKQCLLFIIITLSAGSGAGLLINGDFEQPLTTGWSQYLAGPGIIDRAIDYEPDPDYESQVYVTTKGVYGKLYQKVIIPSIDLRFSTKARLVAWCNELVGHWAGSSLLIAYLDDHGNHLGSTRICAKTSSCPWSNTPIHHIIDAPDSLWHTYTFDVGDELRNLPAVKPSAIKGIEIALYSETYHC